LAKHTTKKKLSADSKPAKKASVKAAPKPAAKPATKSAIKTATKAAARPAPSKSAPVKPVAAKAAPAKPAPAKPGAPKPSAPKKSPAAKPAPAETKARAPGSAPPKAVKPAAKTSGKPKGAASESPARSTAESTPTKSPTPAPKAGSPDAAKPGRKGITIVTPKPVKKTKPKASTGVVPALTGSILGMGLGTGRPLIPSGPATGASASADSDLSGARKGKSPFNKKQLDKYRDILIAKRRELLGDINSMEKEALKSQSGSLSHLPQHMAEQGSETYEQSLSLDLAAADRVLLREIDAALQRIEDRTYGLCEHTGKPISKERLAELPWARYSIEAAREMERRTT